jgi:microcystin-dependent protein
MAYFVSYTDNINKGVITVEDRDINDDVTSLSFPGKGVTEYGSIIAENLLHLLENFAFAEAPDNPVEGQTWYDTTANIDQLKIYNGTEWVPASGIYKAASSPDAVAGGLWVDTSSQQLYLGTGSGWVLVGPQFSQGSSTGPRAALVTGTDNQDYAILIIDIDQVPSVILSSNMFIPKTAIPGFARINAGFNLSTNGPFGPLKYYGRSEGAEALIIQNDYVPADRFLRSDQNTTANGILRVKNNQGIEVGDNNQLSLLTSGQRSLIRNNFNGGGIDFQVKQGADYLRILRLNSNPGGTPRIGVNTLNPQETLDVTGTLKVSDVVKLDLTTNATGPNEGALQVAGGASIAKNLNIGDDIDLSGNLLINQNIVANGPTNQSIDGFDSISASTFIGNFQGTLTGTFDGSAESAGRLLNVTTFSITGDVTSAGVTFDGGGNLSKQFNTTISDDFIIRKTASSVAQPDDEVLINRGSSLFRVRQEDFVASVPTTPLGTIVAHGGDTAPPGWLLCDGSVIDRATYGELFKVIGHKFLDTGVLADDGFSPMLFFGLPDFRGRFPLGSDSMGGVAANRVTDLSAEIVGNSGGFETVGVRVNNLPAHEHNLTSSGINAKQYFAIRDAALDNLNDSPEVVSLNIDTVGAASSSVSGIPTSGQILNGGQTGNDDYRLEAGEELGSPLNTMNPYTTVNYIIYTGNTQ